MRTEKNICVLHCKRNVQDFFGLFLGPHFGNEENSEISQTLYRAINVQTYTGGRRPQTFFGHFRGKNMSKVLYKEMQGFSTQCT